MGKSTKRKLEEAYSKTLIWSTSIEKAKSKHAQEKRAKASFDPVQSIRAYTDLFSVRPIDQFVSRSKSSNPDTLTMEAVRFAFNKYRTPKFLDSVWIAKAQAADILNQQVIHRRHIDFKMWYIALATGQSLYKEYTKGLLTKQETHLFSTCPYDLSVNEALWYAINRAMDIPTSLSRKIASSRLSQYMVNDFWKGVARWFSVNQTSIKEMNDLLDYINHRHTENAEWHLKDHTLKSLVKRMHSWHRELGRSSAMARAYPEWEGIKVPDSSLATGKDDKKYIWRFHQITTGKRLAEEGNKQHHCVLGYASLCASGQCSIWSLTAWDTIGNGIHSLTLEVRSNQVVQIRGKTNRIASTGEMSVVKVWAQKCGFSIAKYA